MATYSQGIQIGNTGVPTTTSGHMSSYCEQISIDSSGNCYTSSGFDEAHFDVRKWRASDGVLLYHSGHIHNDSIEGLAVSADGNTAYATSIWAQTQSDGTRRMKLGRQAYNLTVHFEMTGFGTKSPVIWESWVYNDEIISYPVGYNATDKETASIPIRSVWLHSGVLYMPDSLVQKIRKYNASNGSDAGEITNVPVACGLAVHASTGNIWVGVSHTSVRVYSSAGSLLATPITDLINVRSIAINGDTMFIADYATNTVRKYTISGTSVTLNATFGGPMVEGSRGFNELMAIRAVNLDSSGNLFIADRPWDGARIQKVASSLSSQVWQQVCYEFSAICTFSPANPDRLMSSNGRAYQLNRANNTWSYLGLARLERPNADVLDPLASYYFGHFNRHEEGPCRLITIGSNDFFYFPVREGIAVYRVDPAASGSVGPTTTLVSCLGRMDPLPNGQLRPEGDPLEPYEYMWDWNDSMSAHPSVSRHLYKQPFPTSPLFELECESITADANGDLWVAMTDHWMGSPAPWYRASIWFLPRRGLTAAGSPIYDWSDLVQYFTTDQSMAMVGTTDDPNEWFSWKNVGHEDGMVYALGSTRKVGTPSYPGLHPGGNVLAAFRRPGPFSAPLWHLILPRVAAGLVAIPGGAGGCLIGGDPDTGGIAHYSPTGILLHTWYPSGALIGSYGQGGSVDWICGRLDAVHPLQCGRVPNGALNVFVQDNVNQRVVMFEINDSAGGQLPPQNLRITGVSG